MLIWYSGYWLGIKLWKWTCFCLFYICWSQNNPLVSSSVVTKAAWHCSWVHQVKALSIYDSEQKVCFYLFTQKVVPNELGSIWWIPCNEIEPKKHKWYSNTDSDLLCFLIVLLDWYSLWKWDAELWRKNCIHILLVVR